MKNILLSLITFFGAVFVGGCVNMGIITFGGQLIPPPEGVNPTDIVHASVKEVGHAINLLEKQIQDQFPNIKYIDS